MYWNLFTWRQVVLDNFDGTHTVYSDISNPRFTSQEYPESRVVTNGECTTDNYQVSVGPTAVTGEVEYCADADGNITKRHRNLSPSVSAYVSHSYSDP